MPRAIHVLIIEDNPADADLTAETLSSRSDIDVSVAKDGVEAIELLSNDGSWPNRGRPTLILLDLNLPRKDGRQVLALLKTHDLLRRIPVIILSSSDSEKDITNCYELGANSYITKPMDLEAFRSTVRSVEDFWLGNARLPRRSGHSTETQIGYGL